MSQPPASADEALHHLDLDIAAAQERARQASLFRQTLDTIRGTGTVRGVTVVVDSAGMMRDLSLPDLLSGVRGDDLRRDILAATKEAQRDVAAAVRAEARASFGEDSPVAARMDSELAHRFGDLAD